MKRLFLFVLTLLIVVGGLTACTGGFATTNPTYPGPATPGKTMRAFRSDAELSAYLRRIAERRKRESRRGQNLKK